MTCRWLAASGALWLMACDQPASKPAARPLDAAPALATADAAPAPGDAAPGGGRITLSLQPSSPTTPGAAPATRCTLDGAPPVVPCVGGGALAATADGAVYLALPEGVRRYRRIDAPGCALALDASFGAGGTLAPPDLPPRPQTLGKAPVYLRSGDPRWQLTAAGDRVYLHEFLLGIYRIDRGQAEPVCPGLQGVRGLAIQGDTAITDLDGGTALRLGKGCKARPRPLDPRPGFGVVGIDGQVWGETGSGSLVRYDERGAAVATIGGSDDSFAPGGLCSTVAAAACGDDVCVLDGNCQRLARFDRDGGFRLERTSDQLFGERPYALEGLAPAAGEALWVLTTHRDAEICEAALYLVPAAAITP